MACLISSRQRLDAAIILNPSQAISQAHGICGDRESPVPSFRQITGNVVVSTFFNAESNINYEPELPLPLPGRLWFYLEILDEQHFIALCAVEKLADELLRKQDTEPDPSICRVPRDT